MKLLKLVTLMRSCASFSFCRSKCRLLSLCSKAWCVSETGQLHTAADTLLDFTSWLMSSLTGDEQRDFDALDFEISVLSRDDVIPEFNTAWRPRLPPGSAVFRVLSSKSETGDDLRTQKIKNNHQTANYLRLYYTVMKVN
jgi:hypothetical protein